MSRKAIGFISPPTPPIPAVSDSEAGSGPSPAPKGDRSAPSPSLSDPADLQEGKGKGKEAKRKETSGKVRAREKERADSEATVHEKSHTAALSSGFVLHALRIGGLYAHTHKPRPLNFFDPKSLPKCPFLTSLGTNLAKRLKKNTLISHRRACWRISFSVAPQGLFRFS